MKNIKKLTFLMTLLTIFQSARADSGQLLDYNDRDNYNCTEVIEINPSGKPSSQEAVMSSSIFTTAKTYVEKIDNVKDGQAMIITRTCTTKNPSWNWSNIALAGGGAAAAIGAGFAYAHGINFTDIAKMVQAGVVTPEQVQKLEINAANIAAEQAEINKNIHNENKILGDIAQNQGVVAKRSWFNQPVVMTENDNLEANPYGPTMMQGLANEADTSAKLASAGLGAASVYGPVAAGAAVAAGVNKSLSSVGDGVVTGLGGTVESAATPTIGARIIDAGNAARARLIDLKDAANAKVAQAADSIGATKYIEAGKAAQETGRAGGSFADMGRSAGASYGGAVGGYPGAIDSAATFGALGAKLDAATALPGVKYINPAAQGLKKSVAAGAGLGAGLNGSIAYNTDQDILPAVAKGAIAGGTLGLVYGVPYQGGATVAQALGAGGRGQALAGMGTVVGIGGLGVADAYNKGKMGISNSNVNNAQSNNIQVPVENIAPANDSPVVSNDSAGA